MVIDNGFAVDGVLYRYPSFHDNCARNGVITTWVRYLDDPDNPRFTDWRAADPNHPEGSYTWVGWDEFGNKLPHIVEISRRTDGVGLCSMSTVNNF
jgi:hypothetical protein